MESDVTAQPDHPVSSLQYHGDRAARNRLIVELFIVTAGVLIALLVDGLVDWNHYRALVREARATIAREIADNKKELQGVLTNVDTRNARLENALRYAEELIDKGKTSVSELNLGFEFAELTAAAWQGAERTGAAAHMSYPEVQHYSKIYEMQRLYEEQRRRALGALAVALGSLAVPEPNKARTDDLKLFRQHLMALRAELMIEEQFARQLVKGYDEPMAQSVP